MTVPTRREPPPFRVASVRGIEHLTHRMVRVGLAGRELEGLTVDLPAASVRLLLPSPAGADLVLPSWNGNEFLLPGGVRPIIRTFTPRRVDTERGELDVLIVVHGHGSASTWAETAVAGAPAAISGPGRGFTIAPDAAGFVLAGDETALPAIGQLLEGLPPDRPVDVHLEVADPGARLELPDHPTATVEWHDLPADGTPGATLVHAVRHVEMAAGTRVWAAGEAAAMQRIRRHLFEERGWPRAHSAVRGYWKHGRSADRDRDRDRDRD